MDRRYVPQHAEYSRVTMGAVRLRWTVAAIASFGLPFSFELVVGDSVGSAAGAGVVGAIVLALTTGAIFVRDAIGEARYYRQQDRADE